MRRQGRARKALADCRRAPSIRLTVWLAIFSVIFVPLERLFPVHPQKVFRKQNRGRGLVGTVHVTDGAIAMGVILAGLVWGYFVHANLRWRLGPLEWIVATPGFHHWHHTYGLQTTHPFCRGSIAFLARITCRRFDRRDMEFLNLRQPLSPGRSVGRSRSSPPPRPPM
jgi:hypothetical protein